MKDFYDIYYLSCTFDFDGLKPQAAMQETLQNRGIIYERDSFDRIVALADDESMRFTVRITKHVRFDAMVVCCRSG